MAAELSRPRLIAVTAGAILALLLAALDQTIVGTALPRIVAELNGLDHYAWVLTAYMVASTTMVPIAGKLGDLFGRKPFLIAGMVGFVATSALCGLSQDMTQLIVFRAIQGLFGGTLFATVFTVIADLYPPRTRAKIQGLFGAIFGLSAVVGPTLGGYLTDAFGWRSVFYVNVPVGVIAVAVVALSMPFIRSKASWRDIDFLGAATMVAGLVPLLVALSITRDHDWGSPEVLGLLGVGVALLVVFFVIEQRVEHPIVPFGLFRTPTFTISVIVSFLVAFGMFGAIVFIPLLFQGVLGVSATNSGALLTPMVIGLIVGSVGSGQLITRIPRYRFVGTVGIAIMTTGIWLLSRVTVGTPESDVVRAIVILGLGLGTTMPLYINAVQSAVPKSMLGVASSQVQFWRNMGGTVGTAILGSIFAHEVHDRVAEQIAALKLPPQASGLLQQGGGSAQSLFDPTKLAEARAALPAQAQPLFDQVVHAAQVGLANALSNLFVDGAIIVGVAIVISVFLQDVPLRGHTRTTESDAPVEEGLPAGAFGD